MNKTPNIDCLFLKLICSIKKLSKSSSFMYGCGCVTRAEAEVVKYIGEQDKIKMAELSQKMGVTPSAATQFINKLISAKLVERLGHKNDRRISYVTLTREGKNVLKKYGECLGKITQKFTKGFTSKEKEVLAGFIERILHTLEETHEE
jgi:DNA-binding MarR family transcriptional regulator